MPDSLEMLAFADRRRDGRYPVHAVDGSPVARIRLRLGSRRFEATLPDGSPLCSGRGRRFSRRYEVRDGDDRLRFTVRTEFWETRQRTVTWTNGSARYLQGESWPQRGWVLVDSARRASLTIQSRTGLLTLHPDAYAVRVENPDLALVDIVGIVAANRILVKAARGSAANHAG